MRDRGQVRAWNRYCLTVLWPMVVLFAVSGWATGSTDGAIHAVLAGATVAVWLIFMILGIRGYTKYLKDRVPIRLPWRR